MSAALAILGTWALGGLIFVGAVFGLVTLLWLFCTETGQEVLAGVVLIIALLMLPVACVVAPYQIGKFAQARP